MTAIEKYPTIAVMQLLTLPDLTPGGSAVPLSNNPALKATWIKMAASGATIRVGGSLTSATQGLQLQTGVVTDVAVRGDNPQQGYPLSEVYVYGSGGDKVSITYGV